MRRVLRWAGILLGVALVAAVAGALWWTQAGPEPTDRAREIAAEAGATGYDWLAFGPDAGAVGVVLYPGARIDADAYAPVARTLADLTGARVVVVDPPLDLALLDTGAAGTVISAHPDVDRWVVGGHSLGGVAAARYAADPAHDVDGLLLWASYPAGGDRIADDVAVTTVVGGNDRVLDGAAWEAARSRLPAGAEVVDLAGVTHAQFGDYGTQAGDGAPGVGDIRARRAVARASAGLVERVRSAP